jgi:hypothetical protein
VNDHSCDHGWVTVPAGYAEHAHPYPPRPAVAPGDEALTEWEEVCRFVDAKRATAAKAIFPCPDCRPAAYERWAGGHYLPDHDRTRCAECQHHSKQGKETK